MTRAPRKGPTGRSEAHRTLVRDLGMEVRQLGAHSVMMSQIVADHFGLNTTDLEGLDLIFLRTQVSAGELAAATGLTTGSITALIDRLERAGYVERFDDPQDRRRVLVRIRPNAIEPIAAVYEPLKQRMSELWSRYSDEDLTRMIEFLRASREVGVACAADLAREAPPRPGRGTRRR